jgi:hypothetical protein
MPPSAKQIRDLNDRTPTSLRERDQGAFDDPGPKGALMLWAAARGFNPPDAIRITFNYPDDDELVGGGFVGNVAAVALFYQLIVENEQARTNAIAAAKRQESPPPKPTAFSQIEYLTHMRRIDSNAAGALATRLNLTVIAKQARDALEETRTREKLERAQLDEYLQLFEALKQELAVPLVASGYMNQPKRDKLVAEKTVLLHHLTGMNIPLLRAIAMIGDLRNGLLPVDVEHPKLDGIFDRHSENLQALRKTLQKARGSFEPRARNLPLPRSGNERHKQPQERETPRPRKKR